MKHKEWIEHLKRTHRAMLERLERFDPEKMPANVDVEKLERAYDELSGYAYVLKKIKQQP